MPASLLVVLFVETLWCANSVDDCSGLNCADDGTYFLQRYAQKGLDLKIKAVGGQGKEKQERKRGARWSADEMHAIWQTLSDIFRGDRGTYERRYCALLDRRGNEEYPCVLERLDPNRLESCDSENITGQAKRDELRCNGGRKRMSVGAIPTTPKFLRLGFHDCLRYTDQTGGCDGCLNFKGMFTIFNIDERRSPDSVGKNKKTNLPYDIGKGSNNNLAATADLLEEVYTNVNFGAQREYLTESLRDSGKSRADLWAYATLVVSQWLMERNNERCFKNDPKHLYNEATMALPHKCEITPSRAFKFYTGRVDCPESDKPADYDRVREYQTDKEEEAANAHWSGKQIADFMDREFKFTGRETVAIMGAHQAGAYAAENSLLRYSWGGREVGHEKELNNLYYRMLAYKPLYFQSDLDTIASAVANGLEVPGPRAIAWNMNPRGICPSKGPIQWHMFTYPPAKSGFETGGGQAHITMLNTDVGLYLSFEVTEGGHPIRANDTHCTTLGTKVTGNHKKMPFDVAQSSCRQTYPGGDGNTLADIVEEYANDQDRWWDDYVVALEKMVANGYDDWELEFSGEVYMHTTTTTTTTLLDQCEKKYCCGGIKKKDMCCAGSCGRCGGSGCSKLPGGRALCCHREIQENGPVCQNKTHVGCNIPR